MNTFLYFLMDLIFAYVMDYLLKPWRHPVLVYSDNILLWEEPLLCVRDDHIMSAHNGAELHPEQSDVLRERFSTILQQHKHQ